MGLGPRLPRAPAWQAGGRSVAFDSSQTSTTRKYVEVVIIAPVKARLS
jgi:hypothetical protein